jgi:hypothetical protein
MIASQQPPADQSVLLPSPEAGAEHRAADRFQCSELQLSTAPPPATNEKSKGLSVSLFF